MRFLRKAIGAKFVKRALDAGYKPAEMPLDEEKRIEDLKNLKLVEKNIDKDKRFSSFPKLAATLTECDEAAINIIDDDTQYCKVSYGQSLAGNIMHKEIPRQITICSHVLNNNSKTLMINDLSKDDRTKELFIVNPDMPRFYAGSPIVTSKGYTLGTFCVSDKEPKTLENSKLDGLRMLADQFIDVYESTVINYHNEEIINTDKEKIIGEYYSSATILFSDFVGFTKKTEQLQPGELIEILDSFFSGFDKIMDRFSIRKVKTIGDAYMAVGGIPDLNSDHAKRTVLAAKEMINFVKGLNYQQQALGNEPWHIRIGVHTGPIIAGETTSQFDIWGDSVNIAARLESSGKEMEVHCSEETKAAIPDTFTFSERKDVQLKGKGTLNTFIIK